MGKMLKILDRIIAEAAKRISFKLPSIVVELYFNLHDDFKKTSSSRFGGKTLQTQNFEVEFLMNGKRFSVDISSADSTCRLL